MNQLQNQAKKCWLPWGQSPSPSLILQAALQTAVRSFSLHIHPVPVITKVPSLKSVFPAGKTREERVGTQDLGEGWQLWCVTKQLAVLGAIGSGDRHHTLRRTRIKSKMERSWVIFSSSIVALVGVITSLCFSCGCKA